MLKKFFLFSFFVLYFFSPLFASKLEQSSQDFTFNLPEVTISAPAWEKPISLTGSPQEELSGGDWKFKSSPTIVEMLEFMPGVSVRVPGGPGHIASPNLGGLTGNKVLVVKDGVPVNDPFTGSPDISSISPDSIENIEIWKGNQATKWGSSGIGGVISLNSRQPFEDKLKLSTDGLGGFSYQVESGIKFEKSKLGFRKLHLYTPGFSAASEKDGNTEPDSFENDEFQLGFSHKATNGQRTNINLQWNKSLTELDSFNPVTGKPVDSKTFRQKKLSGELNLGYTVPVHNGEWRFMHAFFHNSLTGIDETNPFNEYGMDFSRQVQTIDRSIEEGRNNYDLELFREETFALNRGNYSSREISSALVACFNRKISRDMSIATAIRSEKNNNTDNVNTGNASISYKRNNFKIEAEAGNAFRNPSLNELFFPNFGDPNLKSEFSSSQRIKASYRFPKLLRLSAVLTKYKIRDMIGTVSTTDPKYSWGIKSANIGQTKLSSHMLSVDEINIGKLNFGGYVEILDSADIKNSTSTPPGVFSRQAAVNVSSSYKNYKFDITSKWWGNCWESVNNKHSDNPGNQVNLHILRNFKNINMSLSIINLTKNSTERVYGYTRPGMRVRMSLETSF